MKRFDLKKLKNAEVKEQYQIKISNRFATLENSDDDVECETFSQRESGSLGVKAA
jgi:putative IMPACT (imprinted ancient) family translation regulator